MDTGTANLHELLNAAVTEEETVSVAEMPETGSDCCELIKFKLSDKLRSGMYRGELNGVVRVKIGVGLGVKLGIGIGVGIGVLVGVGVG